jgi:hypothetical protein
MWISPQPRCASAIYAEQQHLLCSIPNNGPAGVCDIRHDFAQLQCNGGALRTRERRSKAKNPTLSAASKLSGAKRAVNPTPS